MPRPDPPSNQRPWGRILAEDLWNPLGRRALLHQIVPGVWPVARGLASVYRRTLIRRTRVVAVVGSYGKTSAMRALHAVLTGRLDTPLRRNYFSYLAQAVLAIPPWRKRVAIEVGIAAPGQMAIFARLVRPDVVVVTGVGSEHNTSLGALESTRDEKADMVRALGPSGVAVLNADDPNVLWMASQTRARIVTYGFGEGADVRASEIRLDWPAGTRFHLSAGGAERDIHIRLIGWPGVYAVLAALAVAIAEGLDLDSAVGILGVLAPHRGRLEPIRLENGAFLLCDEFKGPIETVESALDVLGQIPAPRRIAVLGEVSEPTAGRGEIGRRVAARAARVASRFLFLGSNESFLRLRAALTREGIPSQAVTFCHHDLRMAADLLREDLKPGDVALIKGRSSQRLRRVVRMVLGAPVRCDVAECAYPRTRCEECPMLERGWPGPRLIT
ncbi:MAG: Mur ligase family protein [Candidatus Sumerlaeota bacterium]|nr:Mur ligase family protein [Candidatus Sumerlaeota bacterium]